MRTVMRPVVRKKQMEYLEGKKTYIVAILLGLATAAKSLGYIDEATFQTLVTMLGSAGLVTMRMAVDPKKPTP